MKNTYMLISIAVIIMASSCAKEVERHEDKPVAETNLEGKLVFSATFDNVKSYDADGKVSWEPGDKIRFCDDKTDASSRNGFDGTVEITLTAENISADGKYASFTLDENQFHAGFTKLNAVTSSGEVNIVSMSKNGDIFINKHSDATKGVRPHVAVASCDKSASMSLTFHNAACIIKWSTRATNIQHLTLRANDGAKIRQAYTINAGSLAVTAEPNTTYDEKYVRSYTGTGAAAAAGGAGTYYMLVSPALNLSKGFTLEAYSGWSDGDVSTTYDGSNDIGKFTTNKALVTSRNQFIDFGIIEEHFDLTHYEAWQAGLDIKIGGIAYNKSNYGEGTRVSRNMALTSAGVYFIDPGVTITVYGSKCKGSIFLIGNIDGQRPTIQFNHNLGPIHSDVTKDVTAFRNVNIIQGDYKNRLFYSQVPCGRIVFDDCFIKLTNGMFDRAKTGYDVGDFTIENCDMLVQNDGPNVDPYYCIQTSTATGVKIGRISIKNNIFYSKGEPQQLRIVNSDATHGAILTNLYIEDNTFYNVDNQSRASVANRGWKPFVMVNKITNDIVVKNNLVYSGYQGSRAFFFFRCNGDTPEDNIIGKLQTSSNYISMIYKNGGMCIIKTVNPDTGEGFYYNGISNLFVDGNTAKPINPFDSADPENGIFTKSAKYSSVGATR